MKKRQKQVEVCDKYNERIDELYRSELIHSSTCIILTEQIVTLLPSERNVILSMNEYKFNELNPTIPSHSDVPSHIIIFCIRFVSDDVFQPIGAFTTFKCQDQSYILAQAVKAYIFDLWKLGLYVVATVSPPTETFKRIVSHLTDIPEIDSYGDILTYSVPPIQGVIHVYDIQFLLIKLQNLFKESDIRFEEESLHNKRVYQASWADISLVLSLSSEFKVISTYLLHDVEISRRVHIFTDQIYTKILNAELQGLLSAYARGSVVLINSIRTFLRFTEQNFVDVKAMNHDIRYWDDLIDILKTMKFHKTKSNSKQQNNECEVTKLNPAIRRRIDFQDNEFNSESAISVEEANTTMPSITGSSKSRSRRSRKKKVGKKPSVNTNCPKLLNTNDTKVTDSVNSNEELDSRSQKTDNVVENVVSDDKKSNTDRNCDIDSNNNSDDGQKAEPKKLKNEQLKFNENNFDVVIDNPEGFLKSLTEAKSASFPSCNFQDNTHQIDTLHTFNKLQDNNNFGNSNSKLEDIPQSNCEQSQSSSSNPNIAIRDHDYAIPMSPTLVSSTPLPTSEFCESSDIFNSERFTEHIDNRSDHFCFEDAIPEINETLTNIRDNAYQLYGSYDTERRNLATNVDDLANDFEVSLNLSDRGNLVVSEERNSSSTVTISPDTMKASIAMAADMFSSKSDEETENSIKESCDKVPNILELLSNAEKSPAYAEASEFEENSFTTEMLCTIFGIEKLMKVYHKKKITVAKPNAFFVEHIDFFVTLIKERNCVPTLPYYGQSYNLLNPELGFSSLENDKGLLTIIKN